MRNKCILSIVLLLLVTAASSQQRFELHLGTSMPTGNFVNDNYDNSILGGSGCAATGITVGAKYLYPIKNTDGLSLTLGVDVIQNGMSQNFKDHFQKEIDNSISNLSNSSQYSSAYSSNIMNNLKIKVNYCNYINIPILGGVSYKLPINNTIAVFANGAFGCNFSSITDLTMTTVYVGSFQGPSQTTKITFDPLTQFATQVGGGVSISNFRLNLNYNQLGAYKFVAKTTSASGNSSSNMNSTSSLTINTYTLSLSMMF